MRFWRASIQKSMLGDHKVLFKNTRCYQYFASLNYNQSILLWRKTSPRREVLLQGTETWPRLDKFFAFFPPPKKNMYILHTFVWNIMVVGQSIIDVQLVEPLISFYQEQRLDIDIGHDRQKCPVCLFSSLQETTTQGGNRQTTSIILEHYNPSESTLILDNYCGCCCKTHVYLMEIG